MEQDSMNEMPDREGASAEEGEFKVADRRHWATEEEGDDTPESSPEPAPPSIIDEFRVRAEAAEQKLQEYIDAFKNFKLEQEAFRERMNRDVDRRVSLKFGELVRDLLETVDSLDLAVEHAGSAPEVQSLAKGVTLAREQFLVALKNHGVERIVPDGAAFDPNEADAVKLEPVDESARDGLVTETLRPGYRLGDLVVRPARVAVGRHTKS